jgi:hypothetical protein
MESTYFKPEEFCCKCGCGFCKLDEELICILDIIREVLGKPMIIKSGCRCQNQNIAQGGEINSDHLKGRAVDIKTLNSHTRFIILNHGLALGINRIGVAPKYIHLGKNPDNVQEVFWLY